jgi:adenylylsulfate kinase
MLILMAGLPGTGKSTIAQQLAVDLPAVVLDKDRIRATLFPPTHIEYSTVQDDFCMTIMLQVAGYLLEKNPSAHVILDGRTFSRQYQVRAVCQWTEQHNVSTMIVECVCADRTARQRLEHDAKVASHLAGNRDYTLYQFIKASFEPIPEPKLVVDTDNALEDCVALCHAYINQEM